MSFIIMNGPVGVKWAMMRTMRQWLTMLCLAAWLAAAPAVVAAPGEGGNGEPRPGSQALGDGLIVPGRRIGPAALSMTISQIIEAVGPRYKRDEFPKEGIVLYEWRAEGLWVSQAIATQTIRVISVFGTTDTYRTEKGLALLHPRAKMEQVYGKGFKEYRYPEDRITLIRYHSLGLQFGIVSQPSSPTIHGRIFQIGVFKPGDLRPLTTPAQ
jgi:hypothetical protein